MENFEFNSNCPFPLVADEKYSYAEAQTHASLVDAWLGFDTERIEKGLAEQGCRFRAPNSKREKQELWIGLALKSLLTPYIEIRNILTKLNPRPGSTIVDLGAGYGRMGFVVARHFAGVNFVGYEYVGERVREGLRCYKSFDQSQIKLIHADLSDPEFSPVHAQYYFIYDYGLPKAIEKTLHDIRRIAQKGAVTVVGRGRSSRDIIERHHPWLSQIIPPQHGAQASIYRSGDME